MSPAPSTSAEPGASPSAQEIRAHEQAQGAVAARFARMGQLFAALSEECQAIAGSGEVQLAACGAQSDVTGMDTTASNAAPAAANTPAAPHRHPASKAEPRLPDVSVGNPGGGTATLAEPAGGITLYELSEEYLADLETRVSHRHAVGTSARLKKAVAALPDGVAEDLDPTVVLRYQRSLSAQGKSNRTCETYVGALRAMMRWGLDLGLISKNPIERLKKLPQSKQHHRRRRRALSEEEIPRFRRAAEVDDDFCESDRAAHGINRIPTLPLFLALLETGMRYGEMRQVRWGDVNREGLTIRLREETTKAQRQREIPIRASLGEVLRELREHHAHVLGRAIEDRDLVFLSPEGSPWPAPTTNLGRIFHRILKRAGIERENEDGERIDIHALRHTAGSRMARNGVPMAVVQKILGHSDPSLTARVYTHLGVEDLRAGVEALPGI